MDLTNLASLGVAIIAAGAAIATQRSASRATVKNTEVSSRTDAEKEAYVRAREFDIETIERQGKEIVELRERNKILEERVTTLQGRLTYLEENYPRIIQEILRDQLGEDD